MGGQKEENSDWKSRNLFCSFKNALYGVKHILTHNYNARLIFLFAIFVVLYGFCLKITKLEMFVLNVAIMVVFIAEVINAIVEDVTDLITIEFHPKIKIIKDVAAGVVLVAVIFTLVLGCSVFMDNILRLWKY